MAENRLFDTNILVYAYDVSETRRRGIAQALVDDVWNAGGGVLTLSVTLVLQFCLHREKNAHAVRGSRVQADWETAEEN